jgi:probable dihydroxyacetone kinase regulator
VSLITKKAIAGSLKKLILQHPLNKLTIRHITDDCGINRQTFYYHFRDIYDLVEWIYTYDAAQAIGENKTYDTWQEGYRQIFHYIEENRDFVTRTYHALSREFLERILYDRTYQLLLGVIREKARGHAVVEGDVSFIAHFYKYGFVGLILDWVDRGLREDPELIITQLNNLICGDIEKALGV